MIGQIISPYRIRDKFRQKDSGQVRESGMSSLVQNDNKSILRTGGVVCKAETLNKNVSIGQSSLVLHDFSRVFLNFISTGAAYEGNGRG